VDLVDGGGAAVSDPLRCPEPELLAAFADRRASAAERREIERHLASCEECCHVLSEVERMREDRRIRPAVAWAGAAAAGLLVASMLWFYRDALPGIGHARSARGGVDQLISALSERRSVDARISGGFGWAPLQPLERSGTGARSTPTWEVLAAASAIRKEADANPSTETLHALGIADFVLGDLDDAVSVLRRVVQESSGSAKSLNDLGAALLERGEVKGRPDDLAEALSCIEKSLAAEPTFAEALFNRAVALEQLHLDDRAATAWETYIAHTSEPGWGDEARRRLQRLRAPEDSGVWESDRDRIAAAAARGDARLVETIVATRVQETREWVERGVLGEWARARASGRREDSDRALATAEVVAGAWLARTGDPMIRDEVAFVRDAESLPGSSPRLPAAIDGRVALCEGDERYSKFVIDAAYRSFESARETLSSIDDPAALSATLGSARCEYYRGRLDRAADRLAPVLAVAEQRGYLALAAQAEALEGLLATVQSRYEDSIREYRKSLATFQRLGEEENAAFLASLLAEPVEALGDERESLRLDLESVSRLRRVRDPGRAVAILEQTALTLARQDRPDVALEFQDAAVERALSGGDAIDAADSLLRRATIAYAAGRTDPAARDLEAARARMSGIADASLRGRVEAELAYAEGRLARAGRQPPAAAAALGASIDFFRKEGFEARLPALFLERARALRLAGDAAGAERDVEAGIEILEAHRAEVLDEELRVTYFDTARDLFSELVSLQLTGGRRDDALTSLERGKTRDLLDRLPPGSTPDLQHADEDLPPGTTVVEYGVLADRLLIWTLARGSRGFAERPIREEDLATLVGGFRDGVERSTDRPESGLGARLRGLLLDPVAPAVAAASTLVFVPDGVLHAVPFAALPDIRADRYLVEARSIVVAPSLTYFLRASPGAAAGSYATPRTILAVGDPAFDTAAFPYLPRLSMAGSEAKRIAKLYPEPVVLTGEAATRTGFLEALGQQDVVHFAGHALGNDTDPARSRLVLAPDPQRHDSGNLFAREIYGRAFGSARLVVLAGCATASGRISRGEGPLSLARPFLAGGVPAVLATLWDIEDASSSELRFQFHREIVAGRSPQEALRHAQLAMIEASDPALRAPKSWAAFEIVGTPVQASTPRSAEG
jgi:CHAT domain-containing protein/tetratricopeptide (TPR) repeat protein